VQQMLMIDIISSQKQSHIQWHHNAMEFFCNYVHHSIHLTVTYLSMRLMVSHAGPVRYLLTPQFLLTLIMTPSSGTS